MKKSLVSILFLSLIISACCKYDEGPLISFIDAKYRVTGNYRIDKFYVNDIDTTNYYLSLNCYADISFRLRDGEGFIASNYHIHNCTGYTGNWGLSKDQCSFHVNNVGNMPVLGPWGQHDLFVWTIIKLTNDDFHIGGKSFNDTYRIEFKKI